jgi:CheY-like chemotaxis protein
MQKNRSAANRRSAVASRDAAGQDAGSGGRMPPAALRWIVLSETLVAGCRVLVADDSPFALELIKAILDKAGCTQLMGAGGGREALALAGENRFDVVLLDVTMPDMNGYEVARQLRATQGTPGPVIVMLSGRDIVEVDIGAREAGADGVMAKPVDRRKLLEMLETLLQQRRALAV